MKLQRTEDINLEASEIQTQSSTGIWKLVVLAMGFVMATLDTTVVNVAIADIQNSLEISFTGITWVVDGYILTFASFLLAGGSLANRYGAKNIYILGLCFFVLASLLCAVAQTADVLIAARLLQGAGAALFMPSSLSLLALSYTDEKQRAKMFGIWAAIVSTSAGLGPFVGGVLVDMIGWQSIFIINLPIGMISLFFTYRIIAQSPRVQGKLNFTSHGLGIITLACFCFTLIEGPSMGWFSLPIVSSTSIAVLSAILFIARERKTENQIIPSQLFRDSRFSAANMVGFLLNFSLFGGVFMLSLFLQEARGASPFIAGLQLLPMMAIFVVGNLLFAKVATRLGSRLPMLLALFTAGLGSLLLVIFISPSMPYWLLAIIFSIINLGVGVTVPAMTAIVMQAAGPSHANMAGATLNANRQIGALVGVAVMGVVIHLSEGWYNSASNTFITMTIAYLTASLLVWRFIRTETKT
ncbi:MFS transporter [Bacillus pseudomycoides]|uniref:MFS transporter n=1 Tax=Bacillus pseudomycoides TaxID=64104 RepID=UPI000BEE6667|nr:MFS transporter [Bacillus pseudomycoides]PEA80266.1 MFS transporter [Bacillus pseudomycoides]PFZ04214.1 MFS transporter [Bacillus pseudomycoides]